MKVLILTILCSIVTIHYSTATTDSDDFILEDRTYSSAEIEGFCATGAIKQYIRKTIEKNSEIKRNFTEEIRKDQILGFVCANVIIRDIQSIEYKAAEIEFPGESSVSIWRRYIHESRRETAQVLRNRIQPSQYTRYADSICRGWPVASKHSFGNWKTVKVAEQLRLSTSLNITEILEKEQPRFLFTVEDMDCLNAFINATGNAEFPYFSFHRLEPTGYSDQVYAAPQLRDSSDKGLCLLKMCKPKDPEKYTQEPK